VSGLAFAGLGAAALALPPGVLLLWARFGPVGDEVGERLDALQPDYDFANLPPIIPSGRDYSGERGEVPSPAAKPPEPDMRPAPVYRDLVRRLGLDPLRERAP
jgi:hypothetical protein